MMMQPANSSRQRVGIAATSRSEMARTVVAVGSALLTITLPIYAWLQALCVTQGVALSQVAAPLWFLLTEGLLAWLVGRGLRGRGALAYISASVAPLVATYLLLVAFSPASPAAPSADLSFGENLNNVLLNLTAPPTSGAVSYGLLAITLYIWWACASDGARLPDVARATRRFYINITAALAATVLTLAAPVAQRAAAAGALMPLLLALIFVGLLSLTFTRIAIEREAPDVDPLFLRSQGRQIGVAAVVAGVVIGLTLIITLSVSPDALTSILVDTGLAAFLSLVGRGLLYLLLAVEAFFHQSPVHGPLLRPQKVQKPRCALHPELPICRKPTPLHLNPPPAWLLYLLALVVLIAVALTVAAVIRAFLHATHRPSAEAFEEERESLGAWSLLGAQLRDLLRPRVRLTHDGEISSTVRALYRDLLRRAAAHGLRREPQQTPREYAAHLQAAPPFSTHDAGYTDDLRLLSEAYAEARYAEREPSATQLAALRERLLRLRALLSQSPRR